MNQSPALYLGVDLGGTRIKIGLADAVGQLAAENTVPTPQGKGPEQVLERIVGESRRLMAEAGIDKAAGMGFAMPGTLDIEAGRTRYLPNLHGRWPDVPVRDLVQAELDCPVYILNDVRAAALGELHFGKGREVQSMVFMALGTGLGGAVVVDNELRLGPIGSAGELGHMTAEPGGRICGCGLKGCLETVVSGPALVGEAVRLLLSGQAPTLYEIVEGDLNRVTPQTMGDAARAGDEKVRAAIDRVAKYLARAIYDLTMALHPQLFVLGGGVAGLGELLFDPVRARVYKMNGMFPLSGLRIEPSAMGEKMGVLGAVALGIHGAEIHPRP